MTGPVNNNFNTGNIGNLGNVNNAGNQDNRVANINNDLPAELHNASPSKFKRAARVLLGIFTLGISEAVISIVHKCTRNPDPEPRLLSARDIGGVGEIGIAANDEAEILESYSIGNNLHEDDFTAHMKQQVKEAFDEVGEAFPNSGFTGKDINDFLAGGRRRVGFLKDALDEFKKTQGDHIGSEQFKQIVKETLITEAKYSILRDLAKDTIEKNGLTNLKDQLPMTLARGTINNAGQAIKSIFGHIQNQEQLERLLNGDESLNKLDVPISLNKIFVNHLQNLNQIATLKDTLVKEYADTFKEYGITADEVSKIFSKTKFGEKIVSGINDYCNGSNKFVDLAEVKNTFRTIMNKYVQRLKDTLKDLEGTILPDETKKTLARDAILSSGSPVDAKFSVYSTLAGFTKSLDFKPLIEILKTGDNKAIVDGLKQYLFTPFMGLIKEKPGEEKTLFQQGFTAKDEAIAFGQDEKQSMYGMMALMLGGFNPELYEAFNNLSNDRMEEILAVLREQGGHAGNATNEEKEFKLMGIPLIGTFLAELNANKNRMNNQ